MFVAVRVPVLFFLDRLSWRVMCVCVGIVTMFVCPGKRYLCQEYLRVSGCSAIIALPPPHACLSARMVTTQATKCTAEL